MYVKVLYDNRAKRGLLSGWGFSCVIDGKILFDTGEASMSLIENMDRMMVSAVDLEAVVISHEHWDHTGGLWEVLARRPGITVHACPGFGEQFKEKVNYFGGHLMEHSERAEIARGVYVTGEIPGLYKGGSMPEQALVMTTDNGVSMLTGCAHPGIVKMIDCVREQFQGMPLYAVCGGFHLMARLWGPHRSLIATFKEYGVKRVGPTHCSGARTEQACKREYGNDFIPARAGDTFNV